MSRTASPNTQLWVMEASLAGNIGMFTSLFADDAVVMPPNDTTLFGKDEVHAWWEDYCRHFRITASVGIEHEVTPAGDQLFERSTASVVIVPTESGPRIRDDIRVLVVWKRETPDTWKISHLIWNSVKPVGSGTNRYMTRMLQKKSGK